MKKLLIVIDMQNDFVTGSLGTEEAKQIVPAVVDKIKKYLTNGDDIIFTRDTHDENYLDSQEGQFLPVEHCIRNTKGWEIIDELKPFVKTVFDKPTFGSLSMANYVAESCNEGSYNEIELIGLCTDICVVSNALLLKANLLDTPISVDAACCAGVTPESHEAALTTMKMCQIKL